MASIQIEKIATYDLDPKKNQFNFQQIIQITTYCCIKKTELNEVKHILKQN